MSFLKGIISKVVGDSNEGQVRKLRPIVDKINALEAQYKSLSDDELREKTTEFKGRLEGRESLDDILPEAFAAVREASRRRIGLRHYDVQLIGGIVLHQGKIAEMKTGEGKTLVATLPLYLNALHGMGAHLVTPNDYLSKVGVQWMGPAYHMLGMTVGVIQSAASNPDAGSFIFDPTYQSSDDRFRGLRPVSRREAYQADITYGTNNEFGFDYLRDNMVWALQQKAQREVNFAIVDEVDNILIDEARTPLIISGPAEESSQLYVRFAELVTHLRSSTNQKNEDEEPDGDYVVDEKARLATLTAHGISKVEGLLGVDNLYTQENLHMSPYLEQALRAEVIYHRDRDYVVQEGEIIIVDEFTGRLMHGRRYSEGLHQAIEAKEGVPIQRESLTLATITFQNFFRMYKKLAGMTGTAYTEREEFQKIYNLEVTAIPTNVAVVREDMTDQVFRTQEAKWRAVGQDILHARLRGQPTLVGTVSIEASEQLSDRLSFARLQAWARIMLLRRVIAENNTIDKKQREEWAQFLSQPIYKIGITELNSISRALKVNPDLFAPENQKSLAEILEVEPSPALTDVLRSGVPHNVLNAKYHEREAQVIAQAGRSGTVTIATNMAGRGVDILLGGNPEGIAREQLRQDGVDLSVIDMETWQQALQESTDITRKDREKVLKLGGLHVIGTERHEARRIDNQLRGRAGRQGDPGSSRFFVSMEDDLMRRFGGQSVAGLMQRFGLEDDIPIEHGIVNKSLENAQVRVEGHNFDIRKHVLEYDDVVNKQRGLIYSEREKVLKHESTKDLVMEMVEQEITTQVQAAMAKTEEEMDLVPLYNDMRIIMPLPPQMNTRQWESMTPEAVIDELVGYAEEVYEEREKHMTPDVMRQVERYVLLRTIDDLWIRHLTALDDIREGIGLRAFGQRDPLVEYKTEAYRAFQELMASIRHDVAHMVFHLEVTREPQQPTRQMYTNREEEIDENDTRARARRRRFAAAQAGGNDSGPRLPSRNDPCWCGSGRKYKNCHLRTDQTGETTPQAVIAGVAQNAGNSAGSNSENTRPEAPAPPAAVAENKGGNNKKKRRGRR
ncbi:MAG: preprotein translocase subunit SecA [Chloroflexi bacterium]|nr:preprotein translocase subunit SecA [Chloroflexota bacterium]